MRAFQYASLILLFVIDHNVHGSNWRKYDESSLEDLTLPVDREFNEESEILLDNVTSTTTTPIKVEEVVAKTNESTTISPVINSSTTIENHQLVVNETTNFTTTTTMTIQSVINSTENDNFQVSTDDVTTWDNDTLVTNSSDYETYNASDDKTNNSTGGNAWEAFKSIFTKSFWEKLFSDSSYVKELVLPIALGFGAGCLITCFFCLCRRLCTKRRLTRHRFDKKYDGKGRDDRWMLLDRHHSSDDDETV